MVSFLELGDYVMGGVYVGGVAGLVAGVVEAVRTSAHAPLEATARALYKCPLPTEEYALVSVFTVVGAGVGALAGAALYRYATSSKPRSRRKESEKND